jgi:hypothetical protein
MWNINQLVYLLDEARALAMRILAYRQDTRYATPATVNAHKVIEMDIYNQLVGKLNTLGDRNVAAGADGGDGAVFGALAPGELRRQVSFVDGTGQPLEEKKFN